MNKKYLIFSGLLYAIAMVLTTISFAETRHLRINCTFHSAYEPFFFRLVEEAGARNSISITQNTPPVGRSLIHVNQGIDDGDGPRISGLSDSFPNLVLVPEPLGKFEFGAFTRDQHLSINSWEGLSELNVAYIHGWKIFDTHVTSAKSITKVKNADLLFKLLANDRADVVLITKLAGYHMIHKLELKNIHFVEPALAVKPNYLYLNRRHESLALLLAETIREIKKDGTYAKLFNEMISPHLPDEK
jgi:polar amino acid transport system substrate-binding protein